MTRALLFALVVSLAPLAGCADDACSGTVLTVRVEGTAAFPNFRVLLLPDGDIARQRERVFDRTELAPAGSGALALRLRFDGAGFDRVEVHVIANADTDAPASASQLVTLAEGCNTVDLVLRPSSGADGQADARDAGVDRTGDIAPEAKLDAATDRSDITVDMLPDAPTDLPRSDMPPQVTLCSRVEANSASSSVAHCPVGTSVIGGGGACTMPNALRVTRPWVAQNGWQVICAAGSASATAICATNASGVTYNSGSGASSVASSCVPGQLVTAGGCECANRITRTSVGGGTATCTCAGTISVGHSVCVGGVLRQALNPTSIAFINSSVSTSASVTCGAGSGVTSASCAPAAPADQIVVADLTLPRTARCTFVANFAMHAASAICVGLPVSPCP
ncbi:MAG: hypothetical protein KC503_28310 [Myxococcales bacterium]|nr:hypothetical protein [Myxococcales bacterium]